MSYYMILNVATAAEIEQQAQMLSNIAIALGVLAGVSLIVSVILFIKLEIKRVIGEKTGRVERKSIEQLEHEATLSGKLQINRSGKRVKKGNTSQMKVQDIFTNLENEAVSMELPGGVETTEPLLNHGADTSHSHTVSDENAASQQEEWTSVLNSGYDETSVLGSGVMTSNAIQPNAASSNELEASETTQDTGGFVIIRNITLIHTSEYI